MKNYSKDSIDITLSRSTTTGRENECDPRRDGQDSEAERVIKKRPKINYVAAISLSISLLFRCSGTAIVLAIGRSCVIVH